MSLPQEQFKVVSTIPMVTGSLSVVGSAMIIFIISRSTDKLKTTFHRIMFGMSLSDIVFSIANILSTIPAPRDTPSCWGLSYGNTTTCTIQGMMLFTGNIGCTSYNCSLALFFMLKISFGVKNELMKKRIEPFFHGVPLLYLIVSNIFLLSKKSFNNLGTMCMITPYPKGCNLNPDIPCTRGKHANEFFWIFHGWPVIVIFILISLAMVTIYYSIRAQEIKMRKYQLPVDSLPDGVVSLRRRVELRRASDTTPQLSSQPSQRQTIFMKFIPSQKLQGNRTPIIPRRTTLSQQRRKDALCQCFLYVSAYFIVFVFAVAHYLAIKSGKFVYPFWVLTAIFTPLQGFFNFMIFIRPRVVAFQKEDLEQSLKQAFLKAILSTGSTTATASRRRSSLRPRANVGRRYSTRELHMLASSRDEADKRVGNEVGDADNTISLKLKESENVSLSDGEEVMHNES